MWLIGMGTKESGEEFARKQRLQKESLRLFVSEDRALYEMFGLTRPSNLLELYTKTMNLNTIKSSFKALGMCCEEGIVLFCYVIF